MRVYDFTELKQIAFELRNGKAAIVETDTVMGILSFDEQLIYKIKKRNQSKKIVLFINRIEDVPFLSADEKNILEKLWPGPLTIVKNKKSYRIPDHKTLRSLIEMTGPVYCSSANFSGKPVIKKWEEAIVEFKSHSMDLIVVKGETKTEKASTVYSFDDEKVLREGIIAEAQIISIINKITL